MSFKLEKILVVDDEKPIREVLCSSLADEGYIVDSADTGESAIEKVRNFQPDVVMLDIWMPGEKDGMDVLRYFQENATNTQFIMMSGHGNIETAVEATHLGAWDFLEKPISIDKVLILLKNIFSYQAEKKEKRGLLNHLRQNIAIVGNSNSAKEIKEMISKVAPSNSWVLLSGEPGVGKELAALNIHYLSQRAGQTFVNFKCGHWSDDLIDGELFGYEQGAIVGEDNVRKGKFDLAHKGTLFLDDVDLLSMGTQAKLLKYLEEKKISRVGGVRNFELDVRIVAATSSDLEAMISDGTFRKDLYFKLNIVPFKIKSLAHRLSDVEQLIRHFSQKCCLRGGYREKIFSKNAMDKLTSYPWPGNIRELKNFVERIYILTPEESIDVHDLIFAGLQTLNDPQPSNIGNFREARAQFEKDFLIHKINENHGNISKTAEAIGLERSYLHRKIKNFGINLDS